MKNGINYSVICTIIVLASCVTNKTVWNDPRNKTYSWAPGYSVASSIEFDSDSTFNYEWVTGLINGGSSGTWYQHNDTIILNSYRQPLQPVYLNQEIRKQQYFSLKIRNYSDSLDVPFVRCEAIAGDTMMGGYTNEIGELIFNLPKIDTINLNSLEFGKQVIVSLPEVNHFDIWLVEKPLNYEPYAFFTNSIWILEERSLIQDSTQRKFELLKRK